MEGETVKLLNLIREHDPICSGSYSKSRRQVPVPAGRTRAELGQTCGILWRPQPVKDFSIWNWVFMGTKWAYTPIVMIWWVVLFLWSSGMMIPVDESVGYKRPTVAVESLQRRLFSTLGVSLIFGLACFSLSGAFWFEDHSWKEPQPVPVEREIQPIPISKPSLATGSRGSTADSPLGAVKPGSALIIQDRTLTSGK